MSNFSRSQKLLNSSLAVLVSALASFSIPAPVVEFGGSFLAPGAQQRFGIEAGVKF